MNITGDLKERFGDYLSADRADDWETVKSRLVIGATVAGTVVARFPFGVFIDLGVGFPALLEVIQFERTGQRPFRNVDDYPAIGTTVSARLVEFNDRNRQVALTQRKPHPYLDRSG
jgi:ribosomal protein S1